MILQVVLMDEGGRDLFPSHGIIITLSRLSCVIIIIMIIIPPIP